MNKVQVTLTDFQKKKIKKAVKQGNNVSIRLQREQLDGDDVIIVNNDMLRKLDLIRTHGQGKDIMLTQENLDQMKTGGFLQFLIPAAIGLVGSLIGGKGISMKTRGPSGSGSGSGCASSCTNNGKYIKIGDGLKLRTGSGLYLKTGNKLYDLTDEPKYGKGFLATVMKVLPTLAKKILPALGLGAITGLASEGASQVVKKIAERKGNGLYIHSKKGGQIYDFTDTIEGQGLLGKLFKAPGGKIPILGDIPLLGALF